MTQVQHPNAWAVLLIAAQVLVSAASMVVEIVAGRVLAPYVGMSLYTWTSIIAVVLAGFSLGHWIGGRVAARPMARALRETAIWMLAAALSTACIIWILRQVAGVALTTFDDQVGAILMLSMAAFFVPSLCAGIPAPVLTQAIMDINPAKAAHRLGIMYAAGAIGAIVGTLASGFVFIAWLGSSLTLAIIVGVYVLLALVFWAMGGGIRNRAGVIIILAGLAIGGLAWSVQAMPSVCTKESDYFCIRVVDVSSDGQTTVRGMVLDHMVHGIGAQDDPMTMYTDHAAALDHLAMNLVPNAAFSAFLIGGGTYSIPRKWQMLFPEAQVTIAEIDPSVTQAAQDSFWYDPTQDTIVHQDARRFLNETQDRYDIVIGDAFTDIAVPEHLITQEFFETVRDRLSPDGYYLMNVIDYSDKMQVIGSIARTLGQVFPNVDIWTEARRPDLGERLVFIVVAGARPAPMNEISFRSPDPMRFAAFDPAFVKQLAGVDGTVTFRDDYIPINRMLGGRFD
jgi:spermidine synthase